MRQSKLLITILTITFCACTHPNASEFKFGIKFNLVRQKFGVPLLKQNMNAYECCKEPTIYRIDEITNDSRAYHSSKTIESFSDSTVFEEADIFRKNINDTTVFNLKMTSLYDWKNMKVSFEATVGKIDKRELKLKATDYFTEKKNEFPNYEFITFFIPCDKISS